LKTLAQVQHEHGVDFDGDYAVEPGEQRLGKRAAAGSDFDNEGA
jgi:hypothetical protein